MESVFKLMPDTSPCDMAIICRKPCFEVYHFSSFVSQAYKFIYFKKNQIYIHRKVIFLDEEILENQQPQRKSAKIKFSKFYCKSLQIYIS